MGRVDIASLLDVPPTAPRFIDCTTRWSERLGMSLRRYPFGDYARKGSSRVRIFRVGRHPVGSRPQVEVRRSSVIGMRRGAVDESGEVTLHLPCERRSVRASRRALDRLLRARGWRDVDIQWAQLAVSELVSNAVVHARSDLIVRIRVNGRVRLEVSDRDARAAVVPRAVEPDRLGGRGPPAGGAGQPPLGSGARRRRQDRLVRGRAPRVGARTGGLTAPGLRTPNIRPGA